MTTAVGLVAVSLSVLLFGSFGLPTKAFPTGDGGMLCMFRFTATRVRLSPCRSMFSMVHVCRDILCRVHCIVHSMWSRAFGWARTSVPPVCSSRERWRRECVGDNRIAPRKQPFHWAFLSSHPKQIIWCTSNLLLVPIVDTIGLGMAMSVWGLSEMLIVRCFT